MAAFLNLVDRPNDIVHVFSLREEHAMFQPHGFAAGAFGNGAKRLEPGVFNLAFIMPAAQGAILSVELPR